jgi:hypothetical protein
MRGRGAGRKMVAEAAGQNRQDITGDFAGAMAAFCLSRQLKGLSSGTLGGYVRRLRPFAAFCQQRGKMPATYSTGTILAYLPRRLAQGTPQTALLSAPLVGRTSRRFGQHDRKARRHFHWLGRLGVGLLVVGGGFAPFRRAVADFR